MSEQLKNDAEISEQLKKMERTQRFSFIGYLADLKPIMGKLTQKEQDTLKVILMSKMTSTESKLAFEIFESGYLERKRFADMVNME